MFVCYIPDRPLLLCVRRVLSFLAKIPSCVAEVKPKPLNRTCRVSVYKVSAHL